jgi:hypothetical protein
MQGTPHTLKGVYTSLTVTTPIWNIRVSGKNKEKTLKCNEPRGYRFFELLDVMLHGKRSSSSK